MGFQDFSLTELQLTSSTQIQWAPDKFQTQWSFLLDSGEHNIWIGIHSWKLTPHKIPTPEEQMEMNLRGNRGHFFVLSAFFWVMHG